MMSLVQVRTLARYNRWQNQSLYTAADGLTDEARKSDRGAFFKSIHGTLCHILFGDQIWLHRFAGTPAPKARSIADSATAITDWVELRAERVRFDQVIIDWAERLDAAWLDGELTWYSGVYNRDVTKPRWLLVTHLFNHQTHHRGQVHAMLTAAGARPEDTDLCFMPGV
ncbi:MAG: DinB family protein [Hyphomicrobiaceae bacterium]